MVKLTSAPDTERRHALSDAIVKALAGLPYVTHVYSFGSIARDEADRFSDIDLLAITQTRPQFRAAFDALRSVHAMIYHAPFTPSLETPGGHVLGCVFERESVFHSLDLNFMTAGEHRAYGALDRFGEMTCLYERPDYETTTTGELTVPAEQETPDEKRIGIAYHFAKKAIKARLRGADNMAVLRERTLKLYVTMKDYPPDVRVPGGEIGQVAQAYLKIARKLLKADS